MARIARVHKIESDDHHLGCEWLVRQTRDQSIAKVGDVRSGDGCIDVHVGPLCEQTVHMAIELNLCHILVSAEHAVRGEHAHGFDLLFDRILPGQIADVVVEPHPVSQVAIRKLLALQPIDGFVGAIEQDRRIYGVPQGRVERLEFHHARCECSVELFFRSFRQGSRNSLHRRWSFQNVVGRAHVLAHVVRPYIATFWGRARMPLLDGLPQLPQFVCCWTSRFLQLLRGS